MAKLRQRPRAHRKGRSPEQPGKVQTPPETSRPMQGQAAGDARASYEPVSRAKTYCQHALSDARAAEERKAKSLANAIANATRTRSQPRHASPGLEKPPLEAQPVTPRKPQLREAALRSRL